MFIHQAIEWSISRVISKLENLGAVRITTRVLARSAFSQLERYARQQYLHATLEGRVTPNNQSSSFSPFLAIVSIPSHLSYNTTAPLSLSAHSIHLRRCHVSEKRPPRLEGTREAHCAIVIALKNFEPVTGAMHTSTPGKACVATWIYIAAGKAEAELYRDQGLKGLVLRTRRPSLACTRT